MPDRAYVSESTQWGQEATPGTAVPAGKTVRSMTIDIDVAGEGEVYRPDGHKFASLPIAPNMEWTTWSADGRLTYTEILYLLEADFGAVTPTALGLTGKKRVYSVGDTADTPKTLTIERGGSVRAAKIAYGVVTDLNFAFSRRNAIGVTAQGLGQLLTDNITMTAAPADVPLVPVVGKQVDAFIDSSAATLGTTKLLRAFSVEPSLGGKFGPVWPINSALASFAGHIELAPTSGVALQVEADAAGMAYLTNYRNGSLIFLRVAATGPEYEATFPYRFWYEACLGINRVRDYGRDADGVAVVTFETELVRDSTWGKALQITVENAVASL